MRHTPRADGEPPLFYAPLSPLTPYGLRPEILVEAASLGASAADVGRIVADHKGGCRVVTEAGEVLAVARGKLSRASAGRPTVGDWVILADAGAGGDRVITRVLTRRTALVRKSAGRETVPQVLATNIDVALIVCALGRDVNSRRIERLATLAHNGGVHPVVVLTKADTCADPAPFIAQARKAAPDCLVHVVSARTGVGLAVLSEHFAEGATVTLLGTSGAGKSTLVNYWLGGAVQSTGDVRDDGKGRHTTTSRQLYLLPTGGAVVDTPGLREVALWTGEAGLDATFDDIEALAPGCRFGDCGHDSEPDCAVRAAVLAGTLDRARHESYLALRSELAGTAKNLEVAQRAERARARVLNRAVAARLQRERK
jgi:ribosome biogenesis GTPase